jgi:D-aspartate ligase
VRSRAKPPAIVFGGEAIALPVVRSLARAGVEVHAVGDDPAYDPVCYSRYCAGYTNLGSKDGVVDRWLDWLAGGAPEGAVLLSCSDESLELILRHRAEVEELGHTPMEAKGEVLAAMLDKDKTHELAAELGIDAPRTWTARSDLSLDEAIEEIGFPCAIKPLHSHLFAHVFGAANKLLVANDRSQLATGLERMHKLGLEMSVTEIIPGPDTALESYCGYLDERGEPLTHFTFRKLRQFPIHFGLGCYVVSDWNRDVIDAGLRFLRGSGLRGLFHVEFKRDPRDGRLKLLECNHRFTIEAVFSPVDLPLLAYNRVVGLPAPPARPPRNGTYLWSPVNDARAFLSYRRRGELTLAGWARTLLHRQRFHAFQWSDPFPAIYYHLAWLGRILGRVLQRRGNERPNDPLMPPRR